MNLINKIFFCPAIVVALSFVLLNSCKKEKETPIVVHETGTVTDIDGNVYKTIKIGNQWWMAENLSTRRYRNGNYIYMAQSDIDWSDTTASYCVYENSSHAPGYLYNWYAISDTGNLAPAGWHIPTDDEWKVLEKFLGMNQSDADKVGWRGTHEGEKLKIESPGGWTSYGNVWSTNESGFSALGGSCRLFDGTWGLPGLSSTGFWWSSSGYSDKEIWYRYLDYKNANVFRSHCQKNYGFSVRCVKDN